MDPQFYKLIDNEPQWKRADKQSRCCEFIKSKFWLNTLKYLIIVPRYGLLGTQYPNYAKSHLK